MQHAGEVKNSYKICVGKREGEGRGSPGSWLRRAGTDLHRRGVFKILQRWQTCIDREGDFVEK
jgi:hypothetical protein